MFAVPLVIEGQVATDSEGIRKFLGVSESRWVEIRSGVPALGKNWYSYTDVWEYIQKLSDEKKRSVRSEGVRSKDEPTKEFLQRLQQGGRNGKSKAGSR